MNTYPLVPNRITETSLSYSTKKVEFEESQYVQRIATRKTPKQVFRLEHYALTDEYEKILKAFFNEVKGAFKKFYFKNHIDGKTYECHFKDDTLRINRINAAFCNITVEIEGSGTDAA